LADQITIGSRRKRAGETNGGSFTRTPRARLGFHLVVRGAGVISLAVFALGCRNAQEEARGEAGVVSRAIDGVRAADNAAKAVALGALRSAPCSHPDVCRVRSACLSAYELHVSALKSAVEAQAFIDAGSADRAAAVLASAEQDLKRSAKLAQRCTEQQGELIRGFRL
jgi:hypothetical protein